MKFRNLIIAAAVTLFFASCSKDTSIVSFDENRFVNSFARDLFETSYLWAAEVSDEIAAWDMSANPIDNVSVSRQKDAGGNLIDRWTVLMPDSKQFLSSVSSTKASFGFDYRLYFKESSGEELVLVVLYVHPDGPAAEVGLKRGDVVEKVNGISINRSNYASVLRVIDYPSQSCTFTMLKGGTEISVAPKEFKESPVLLKKVFDNGESKIGYMVFNSFNMDADADLLEAGGFFRKNGVKELILDLRYNSGGYLITEKILASILLPKSAVDAKELYSVNVLNKRLTQAISDKSKLETRLSFDFEYELEGVKHKFSSADANIGLSKLYVLTGPRTASASESLICCISAFMPVEIIGERTVGKFCGGQLFKGCEWYEMKKSRSAVEYRDNDMGDWCLYLMTAMWTDKFGKNSAYPSGIAPGIDLREDPIDMVPLGDTGELLLAKALERAGFADEVKPAGVYRKSAELTYPYNIYYAGEIASRLALRIAPHGE